MKIITKRKQEELDKMAIKKLRFVARATLLNFRLLPEKSAKDMERNNAEVHKAMDSAEQVFYADNVM